MTAKSLKGSKILVVEDDPSIREGVLATLKFEGHTVLAAGDGERGWELFEKESPDLVILDVMLPKVSGHELIRMIRRVAPEQAVLFLSARGSEADRVLGLDLGADDYIVKPFGIRELSARVRALLRRRHEEAPGNMTFDDVVIDMDSRKVTRAGAEVPMTSLEFDLLACFVKNAGKALRRDELLDKVWGREYFGTSRTIDNFITKLRSKLEKDPKHPKRFLSLRGLGYRFDL